MNKITSKKQIPQTANDEQNILQDDFAKVLFALYEGLANNVLSQDVWWLAENTAKHISKEKYNITEEKFNQILEKLSAARKEAFHKNPMHSMF